MLSQSRLAKIGLSASPSIKSKKSSAQLGDRRGSLPVQQPKTTKEIPAVSETNSNQDGEHLLSKDPSALLLDVPDMTLPTATEQPSAAAEQRPSPKNERDKSIKRIYSSRLGVNKEPSSVKPTETVD